MSDEVAYEKCKAFVLELGPILFGSGSFKEAFLNIENAEQLSMTAARKGMRMAVADILEATARLPSNKVSEIDEKLGSANAPTLTEMRAASSGFVRRLLKKKKIESEDEFLMLRGISESGIINDKTTLEKLKRRLGEYEGI